MRARRLTTGPVRSMLVAAMVFLQVSAGEAANVADLYAARVPVAGTDPAALDDAFGRALAEVLVKVTGQRNAAVEPAPRRVLTNPGALVRQYQQLPGGFLRVQFDATALRGRLDTANLPVWGDDRPLLLAWVPVDGGGPGQLLTDAGPAPAPGADAAVPSAQDPTADLRLTAAARGIPLVFPIADVAAGPASAQGVESAAGAVRDRMGAGAVLIGQGSPTGGAGLRRWTLLIGDERFEWQGDARDGVNGATDRLAARYASGSSAVRLVRLRVTGVDSFDGYGRLQSYLRTVGLIQGSSIVRVAADGIVWDLRVRGETDRLRDAFALRRVLEPVADDAAASPADASVELTYRLVPVR